MKNNFKSKSQPKPVRKVFLIGFISIFFILTILIGGVIYVLNLNGISIEKVRNPEPSIFLICVGCLICSFSEFLLTSSHRQIAYNHRADNKTCGICDHCVCNRTGFVLGQDL